jgi:hypothetical protein
VRPLTSRGCRSLDIDGIRWYFATERPLACSTNPLAIRRSRACRLYRVLKHEHSLLNPKGPAVKIPKALRAEINDVVVKYTERKLRKDGTLDVAVMAHEMTQSLVDMIMDHDEHHHAQLLALMILSLGDEYLQRTGIGERRDN